MALIIPNYTYITHKLIPRPWGPECRFTVARPDGTHINEVVSIKTMQINDTDLVAIISNLLARMKTEEDRQAKFSRVFDSYGPEIKQAVHWIIRKVRANPNATVAQAETAWNAEWADSLFTFDKMVTFVQREVGNVTWAQFKTFVINHYFEGVD